MKMVVVNQQSEGSTSSVDEFASSKEEDLKQVMIRLYSGGLQGNVTGVSPSSSSKAEMELMIRNIYKETICPMICAEINAKQQNFLSLMKEQFGFNLLSGITWNFDHMASTLGSQALKLKFINGISTPVCTGSNIKGIDSKPFTLATVDVISEEIVSTVMEVEIVILKADSNDKQPENWTSDEFNSRIVREWNGKRVLHGNTLVNLKGGIFNVDEISFTHNSTWKGIRKYRVGAMPVNAVLYNRVKEAITESVLVTDKRNQMYKKHPNPSLSDHVYHLNKISSRGECFKRLSKANIKTVMDLLTINAINPKRLQEILDVRTNTWKAIMDHAEMCKDDRNGTYLYHYPRDGQKSKGVVFNMSGQLVGVITESQFVPCDKLPEDKKAFAQKLIVSSSEYWNEVVSFKDLTSLINRFQPNTTSNSLRNGLHVGIPQTIATHDHTSLTSPQVITPNSPIGWSTNNNNNNTFTNNVRGYDRIGEAGQSQIQIQSPKRCASQHAISISPKKPRDDHVPMSLSTPRVGNTNPNNLLEYSGIFEDDDVYLQYLDDLTFDRWKMVWYVVGWISMITKVRKRKMNFCHDDTMIVIAASMT